MAHAFPKDTLPKDTLPEDEPESEIRKDSQYSTGYYVATMVWTFIFFYALYLAFSCGDSNFFSVLGAIFFSPLYVIYKLATKCNLNGSLKAPRMSFH